MLKEERTRILNMVKEGKITTEEGIELLEVLEENETEAETEAKTVAVGKKRMLRIVVDAKDAHKKDAKVRVNIPLSVAKKLAKLTNMIPNSAKKEMLEQGVNLDEIDLEGLIDLFEKGELDENLIDVEAEGASVKIYVD